MPEIDPIKQSEVDDIIHYDVEEMLDVYRFEKMKVETSRENMKQALHRMAVLAACIKKKQNIEDPKQVLDWINKELSNPERPWNK